MADGLSFVLNDTCFDRRNYRIAFECIMLIVLFLCTAAVSRSLRIVSDSEAREDPASHDAAEASSGHGELIEDLGLDADVDALEEEPNLTEDFTIFKAHSVSATQTRNASATQSLQGLQSDQRTSSSVMLVMQSFKEQAEAAGFNPHEFFNERGMPKANHLITKYLTLLMENRRTFSQAPPTVTSRPEPLENPPNCHDSGFFSGPRKKPAHLVMIVTVSYEMDILEAVLNELYDVVDEFIVMEGKYTQRGAHKPQVYEQEKSRLAQFFPKITYFYQRDQDLTFKPNDIPENVNNRAAWKNEDIRRQAYNRYVEGEQLANRSLANTLFVNADMDEIPPANGLQRFKYCATKHLPANLCSSIVDPDMEHIVEIHGNHCGRLGDHYWPHPNIMRAGESLRPGRKNHTPYDELVGVHFHGRDPWSSLAKALSVAEMGTWQGSAAHPEILLDPWSLYKNYACGLKSRTGSNDMHHHAANAWHSYWRTEEVKFPIMLPWFFAQNKERFPYLYPSQHPEFACPESFQERKSNPPNLTPRANRRKPPPPHVHKNKVALPNRKKGPRGFFKNHR
eukprot:gnl/TRDRNA2_/TRDRNA2_81174_c0_seq1.p1 gnl/TRDRNA2_/TRDRNA2_81174_c0~~gnl/TRDRNA2_/TRDRNA2_81174_c0_seq1.p1  ORF type:complete len:565 (+),score=62.96 gnl/TRDRNA2_/TRDRNA2_81174_c0_seq1:47-1741(+)